MSVETVSSEQSKVAIRVLLCEDHELVRKGISGLLSYVEDIEVVGEAANGFEAVKLARTLRPDVILMDLEMPVMSGLEALARIKVESPEARVLVLTASQTDSELHGALEEGAIGYMLKSGAPDEFFRAIRIVQAGNSYVAPTLGGRLMGLGAGGRDFVFTRDDIEVLQRVALGESNKEIGVGLRIAESTARNKIQMLCARLKANGRTHLAALAVESGLVRVGR